MEDLLTILDNIKNGNQDSFNILKKKYSPLIHSEAESFSYSGTGSLNDLILDAESALLKAALTFDSEKNIKFGYYAKVCIRNSLISKFRKENSIKRKEEKKSKSYDYNNTFINGISSELSQNIISELLTNELSEYEKLVLDYFLDGMKPREIAQVLNSSSKSVSNAIFRIKAKIKNII